MKITANYLTIMAWGTSHLIQTPYRCLCRFLRGKLIMKRPPLAVNYLRDNTTTLIDRRQYNLEEI